MRRQILLFLFAAGLLSIALVAGACGGNDNNSDSGADNPSDGATVTAAATSTKNSSGGGSDESYVAAICKAALNFQNELQEVVGEPDETEVVKKLSSALDSLTRAFEKANPPNDAKPFHDEIVRFFKDARRQISEKGPDALAELELPVPAEGISARMEKVAAANKDCQDANFSFSE